ncbi:hypothetical protein BASA81_018311 [Batrachochytrium salamandrivorans]|nr:hypothetical protein BASA81_018311 [Batrachochytrium salamandrivorans]
MTYGAPLRLSSIVANRFLAEGIDLFERENRIRHLATTPYHPQTMELGEFGQARSAANVRTKAQAEAMRKRNNFDETTSDYFFKLGDMVKMKHHDRLKLEFPMERPYHVCRCWTSRNLLDMTPQGLRLPNAVNQNDLAPWLAPVVDNIDFFYDGTNRNTALTGDETSTSH